MKKVRFCNFVLMVTLSFLFSASVWAENISLPVYSIGNNATLLGTLSLVENPNGVLITPQVKLPQGAHALRLVPQTLCDATVLAAYTRPSTDDASHATPFLPLLIVNSSNEATSTVLARGLTLKDFKKKMIVIYSSENPYPDQIFPRFAGNIIACSQANKN